ncbi:MAG: 6-bladed beta-propeller [Candidatus Aminicenantes bacterium]|nr:6-bladed beta-propeller [Candidatus Aminicenantes bacterium]
MRKSVFIMLVLFLVSSCGKKQNQVDRITEDGVEVVINRLEPYKIKDQPSSLSLDKEFSIDTEEDEIANLGIPDILGFEVNSSGEIFILRTYTGEGDFIFKFDSSGKFVKSFGPQGQGPGEFQNPHHIALDSEDNVVIIDSGRSILLKYHKDGVFIDDYGTTRGTRVSSAPRENLLVLESSLDSENGRTVYSSSLKLLNPDLEVLQVIDKLSYEMKPGKFRVTEPLLCWSTSGDNIYVANEERGYEIWVYDFNGKLVRKIRKEYRRTPVSEDYKNKILEPFPEDMRNMAYFPEFHPPFQSIVAAADGKLLASTYEAGNSPGEFMFDIFNEDGVFIGRKSLNIWVWEGHLWARMRTNKFYWLLEKESGYKELVAYRMKWE